MTHRHDVDVHSTRNWIEEGADDRGLHRPLAEHSDRWRWAQDPRETAWLSEESFPRPGQRRPDRAGYEPVPRTRGEDHGAWSRAQQDFRGRGPKGYRRSDVRIAEEVHERLTDDPWLDAVDIDVAVKDGEVTLAGTVSDRQARRRAEDVVEAISGVGYVQNNLRVDRHEPPASGAHEKTISELSMRNPTVRPTPSVASQIGGLSVP